MFLSCSLKVESQLMVNSDNINMSKTTYKTSFTFAEHNHGAEHHHDTAGLCHDHPHSEGDESDGDAHACGHPDEKQEGD